MNNVYRIYLVAIARGIVSLLWVSQMAHMKTFFGDDFLLLRIFNQTSI